LYAISLFNSVEKDAELKSQKNEISVLGRPSIEVFNDATRLLSREGLKATK
jgi:hypothetical protein